MIRNIQPKYTMWSADQTLTTASYTTVWSGNSDTYVKGAFYEAIWQLNSDKILIQVIVNSITILDLDLEELSNDFKLESNGISNLVFSLQKYGTQRWIFRPPSPIRIDKNSSVSIKMKVKTGNDKLLVRGLSVWGDDA